MALTPAEKQAAYRERKRLEAQAEAQAVELGTRYGGQEADHRGETGELRADRIERAVRYQRFAAGLPNEPLPSLASHRPPCLVSANGADPKPSGR